MKHFLLSMAVLVLFCGGCKTPLRIGEKQEIKIGQAAAGKLEAEQGVWEDRAQTSRVRRIGMSIAENSARPGLPWSFKILNESQVNALALPGGFVYVTRGLIESGMGDEELAGIIGHEVSHVTERHGVKRLEKALTASLLLDIATQESSEATQKAADIVLELALREGYREEEYEADRKGTELSYRTGYRAEGLLNFLRKIREMEGRNPSQLEVWMSTHPPTAKRIARLEAFLPSLIRR